VDAQSGNAAHYVWSRARRAAVSMSYPILRTIVAFAMTIRGAADAVLQIGQRAATVGLLE